MMTDDGDADMNIHTLWRVCSPPQEKQVLSISMCGLHAPLFEYILGTSGRRRGRVASAFRAVPSGVIPVCGARRFEITE
jgi:hypothetical protein